MGPICVSGKGGMKPLPLESGEFGEAAESRNLGGSGGTIGNATREDRPTPRLALNLVNRRKGHLITQD